ncbi:AAA family ATPase [Nonomuraea typhae]|uniref:AAA family ATPase n=1 Tax=Nonomuraea typhae TaxID=2603600 RepID=UPI001FEA80D6|nr:ATP-binding protein [Nonomuraea typhae]
MLHGRDHEQAAIERLLSAARDGASGALMLRGEPGAGKSALLAHAVEQAGEMRVLRGAGIESEAELPFAALHMLLRSELARIPALPEAQAGALQGALGLGSAAPENRFLVGLAVLSLLAEIAGEGSLLCLNSTTPSGSTGPPSTRSRSSPAASTPKASPSSSPPATPTTPPACPSSPCAAWTGTAPSPSCPPTSPPPSATASSTRRTATRSPCSNCPPTSPRNSGPATSPPTPRSPSPAGSGRRSCGRSPRCPNAHSSCWPCSPPTTPAHSP